ncbi:hypothetical protein B0H19DRAFT_1209087 [Mycena capillaripes]|nr:hypothetical protein B0H19DRAFT_1209087 [Mycena capillaripes]
MWAPCLYKYYHKHNRKLCQHFPHLRRTFTKSVFSGAAFNFGPNVWTFKHRDILNLPFGRHLVLWDLMLVIEFPPGALVLILSATLSHSNVPVQPGDKHISFTQFTAALKETRWEMGMGLFSTVDELFDNK